MEKIKIRKLCNIISKYKNVVLYGAGYVAERLAGVLLENKVHLQYIVVTNPNKNIHTMKGIPIYSIEDKLDELQSSNTLIIIAVTVKYENEIVSILNKNGISSICKYTDCVCGNDTDNSFWNKYKDKDTNWYMNQIEEWYYEQYAETIELRSYIANVQVNNNRINFVVENLSPRVIKILKALKAIGKEVVIYLNPARVNRGHQIVDFLYNSLKKQNIEIHFFECIEELLFLLISNKGIVTHIFSDCLAKYPYLLVKLQNLVGNVVFENYDIINGFYTGYDKSAYEIEKYCIENAKGVVYREYDLEYLIDKLNLDIKGKTLNFCDYCNDIRIDYSKIDDNKELSICHVGGIVDVDDDSIHQFGGIMEIAKKCEEQHCHFHIYPSRWDEERYDKYIKKSQESKYFHFHKPLPYDEMIKVISNYDYGLTPSRHVTKKNENYGNYTKYKYIYAASNQLYDYLDAGLPIIAALPVKYADFFEQKKVLIKWYIDEYDFEALKLRRNEMKRNVVKVQEELRMGNHINELIKLYETI